MKWIFLVRSARKREKPDSGGPREYLEVDGRVSGGRIASGYDAVRASADLLETVLRHAAIALGQEGGGHVVSACWVAVV